MKLSLRRGRSLHVVFAVLLIAMVAAAAVFKGGVHPRHMGWVIAACAVLGIAWTWLETPLPALEGRRNATRGLVLTGLALLLVAAPLTPLPPAVVRSLSPARMALVDPVAPEALGDEGAWLDAMAELDLEASVGLGGDEVVLPGSLGSGGATRNRPLHLDPRDGTWELLRWSGAAIVFALALGIARRRRGAVALAAGLTLLGVFEGFWGLSNQSGAEASLGFFAKEHYLGSATGTLVNRNHYAALIVLCLGGCWGLASTLFPLRPQVVRNHARRRNRSTQPPNLIEAAGEKLPQLMLLAFFAGVMALSVVLSRSRAGLLTLCLAGLLVALIGWRRRQESWHVVLGVGLPAAGTLLAVAALGVGGALGRFRALLRGDNSVTGRLEVWGDTLRAWTDMPLVGTGVGSFDQVYPTRVEEPYLFHFAHAHNDLLQLLFEDGLLLTVPLLIG